MAFALFTTACTQAPGTGGSSFDSVRERLEDDSTRMYIGSEDSSGNVTARRWTTAGWVEGVTPVTIEAGEVRASVDAAGKLTIDNFEVEVAPIDIPEEVFKKPAQLTDVRVKLVAPVSADVNWYSDDEATARVTLDLDLDWAIAVNAGKTPLGTQHLPPIAIDLALAGGGDHIEASVALDASGELWSWAGLLEMTRLELSLAAGSVD